MSSGTCQLQPAAVTASAATTSAPGRNSDEDLSDWEKEIDPEGNLFYVIACDEVEWLPDQSSTWAAEGVTRRGSQRRKKGKLLRLVRRQGSRTGHSARKGLVSSSGGQPESSDNDSISTYGQIKTFETLFQEAMTIKSAGTADSNLSSLGGSSSSSSEMTEIHEVYVKFNAKQLKSQVPQLQQLLLEPNAKNDGLLLEVALGVVAEKWASSIGRSLSENSIFLSGYLAHSPAAKISEQLRHGDIVRSLDGVHVTMDSVNTFLMQKLTAHSNATSCKVKLIIQRAKHSARKLDCVNRGPRLADSCLPERSLIDYYEIVHGHHDRVLQELQKWPHFAIYIANQQTAASAEGDVLFVYPETETDFRKTCIQIRGVFVTLNRCLEDVLHDGPLKLVVSTLVMGNGSSPSDLVHVVQIEEHQHDGLLLLGIPGSKISSKSAVEFGKYVSHFFRFHWGSVFQAVSDGDRATLCKWMRLLFMDVLLDLSPEPSTRDALAPKEVPFENELSAAQWLHLPDEIRFQAEDALNQLECADYQDDADDLYELPREFQITGSCLFHKGLLLATHLDKSQLDCVRIWCRAHKILQMMQTRPMHRIVIWQRVFLQEKDCCPQTFLLVVGQQFQLLCVLLQTGGCAAQASGIVKPDAFYVDQAFRTLDHLQAMGIPLVCNKWLTLSPNPKLASVDGLHQKGDMRKKTGKLKANATPEVPSKSAGVVLCHTKPVERGWHDGSEESDSDLQNSSSDMSEELQTVFREEDDSQHASSLSDKMAKRSGDSPLDFPVAHSARCSESGPHWNWCPSGNASLANLLTYKVSQMCLSSENVILHFLHFDLGEGVFMAPLQTPRTPYHCEMLRQFRAACHIIHANFQIATRSREVVRTRESAKIWLNRNVLALKEQAMLFHWKPQALGPVWSRGKTTSPSAAPVFSYWVCGRLLVSPSGSVKECYVAYHESAAQLTIELAFKLAFGVQI